jgi:hypothetical protein
MKTPESRQRSRANVTDLFPQNSSLSDDPDPRRRQFAHDLRHLRQKDLIERYPAEWNCFRGMKGRARTGTAVVDPRLAQFKSFLSSLGPCPVPGYTVDRLDPFDPEYAPDKVQWASKVAQANNRTNTVMLRGRDGRVKPIGEWARLTRQKADTLRKRYERGWTDIEIIAGERSRIHGHDDAKVNASSRGTGRWPALVEDERPFERAWRAWTSQKPWQSMSRETLVAWLLVNRQRRRSAILQKRYPDQFGEDADPYSPPRPPLTEDPDYATYLRAAAEIDEIHRKLDATQKRLLLGLLEDEIPVLGPSQIEARAAERRAAGSDHKTCPNCGSEV